MGARLARGVSRRPVAAAFVALLATVIAGSAAPPAGADHPTTGPYVPNTAVSLATDGSYVYYSSYDGCPGGEFPSTCRVRAMTAGGEHEPAVHYQKWNLTDPGDAIVSNIAKAGRYFYWVNAAGRLVRSRDWANPHDGTTVATLRDPTATAIVAADFSHVYWVENGSSGGRLYRSRGPGIAPELIAENPRRPLRQLAADGFGGVLYVTTRPVFLFCCADMLERVKRTPDGGTEVVRGDVQGVQAFTTDDRGSVYFVDRIGRTARLREAWIEDLTRDTVLPVTIDPASLSGFGAMTARGGNLFFQPLYGGRGPILRVPARGGTPVPVTSSSLGQIREWGAAGEFLFALANERVHRLPVSGAAEVQLDIDGSRAPEVVQIIQNEAHDVPMVAGKRTFVRVYGRLASAADGVSSLALNPPALLYGTRDGVRLPGSPLRPIQVKPIPAGEVDRTTMDTTFLFELPYEWRFGTVTLRSTTNEWRSVIERDHTNNAASRTVAFRTTTGVCLDMLPVLTHAGVSETVARPGTGSHFLRMRSLYPLVRMYPIWRGGPARTIPVVGDHYNMRDGDHKNMLMMNLNAELGHQGKPSQCRAEDRLIRTVLVPDSDRFGLSSGIGPYIYALLGLGSSFPQNDPDGGVKGLAHEIGHQHGFAHVRCPTSGPRVPGSPHESWPYPTTCHIDSTNDHIGYDATSGLLVVPLDSAGMPIANDFNSYGPQVQWPSRYTFDKIFRQHAGGVSVPPATAMSLVFVSDNPGAAAKVVAGYVDADGLARLAHVNTASGPPLEELRKRLAEAAAPSNRYAVRAYDAAGALLREEALTGAVGNEEGDGATFEFLHLLPDDPAISRIAVVDVQTKAELTSMDGGEAAPEVSITSPEPGDIAGSNVTFAWSSSDPDGDEPAHMVRYSTDGGSSWQVLTSGLAGESLEIDLSGMPGSKAAFLEVVASDGVHSTAARVGPFTVPAKQPTVTITSSAFEVLDGSRGASMPQSGSLTLFGSGYDAEDGSLDGEALRWTLSGPVKVARAGDELVLGELPPGSYAVVLEARDADGNVATAETRLDVLGKQVAGAAPPRLDGACDDAGYLADADAILLRRAATTSVLAFVHSGGDLYACASGLLGNAQLTAELELAFGLGQAGDYFVRIEQDGSATVAFGDGKGGRVPSTGDGIDVAVGGDAERWHAELRLDGDVLGKLGPAVRLRAAEGDPQKPASVWPAGSQPDLPATWGLATLGGDAPPVLSVPPGLTVSATGPGGAVVKYEVDASDAEDGQATVECKPPSGSLFAVGTTTVTCVARDSAGNQTVATFDVRVLATGRSEKQAVRDALAALLPTGDAKADAALKAALAALDRAITAAAWDDGDRPDDKKGKAVFDGEAAAVEHLARLKQPPKQVTGAIGALVAVDAGLVEVALGDAYGAFAANESGDAKLLRRAGLELAKARAFAVRADRMADAGRPKQAIVLYRQAWHFAGKSLELATRAG